MTFEERIANTVKEKLNDGTVEKIIAEEMKKAIQSAVSRAFGWKGEIQNAIDEKVKEVIAPAIERSDLSAYVVKLDTILTEIINSTSLVDNREILENFKNLMTEPEKKVTLEDVFGKYNEYVSRYVDTSELEVITDDEPAYADVNTKVEWRQMERQYGGEMIELCFSCDEDRSLEKTVCLRNWFDDGYKVYGFEDCSSRVDLRSLRNIDSFELYLMTLKRAGSVIWNIEDMEDGVEVEDTPEASWS